MYEKEEMSDLVGIYIKYNNSYSKKVRHYKKAMESDTEGHNSMLHIIRAEDRQKGFCLNNHSFTVEPNFLQDLPGANAGTHQMIGDSEH